MTGDEFEELYRATAREVFGYVRRRTTGDVEDLVAEVYTIAWRRRSDLPAPMLRRAWLFGTARKLMLAEARRRGAEGQAVAALAALPDAAVNEPESGTGAIVRAALDRLPEKEREVLRMVEWECLTPAELAVALGIRPGTARVRLHRARRALGADPELAALVDPARIGHQPDSGLRNRLGDDESRALARFLPG